MTFVPVFAQSYLHEANSAFVKGESAYILQRHIKRIYYQKFYLKTSLRRYHSRLSVYFSRFITQGHKSFINITKTIQ